MAGIRLGVFGGTFNPVHLGHIHVARQTQRLFGLSRIIFVVASTPPHKPGLDIVPFVHRYAMVALAAASSRDFVPSTIELDPPASSFSIDTMRKLALRRQEPCSALYFIAGGDSLSEVQTWHRAEELLSLYNFIFVVRPGVRIADARELLPPAAASRFRDLRGLGRRRISREVARGISEQTFVYLVDLNAPDIAASRVRTLAAAGRRFDRLVPASVAQYIKKLRLYGER